MTDPDRMPIPTREFYMKLLESPDLKVFFETHAGEMEIPPFHKFISEICARSGQVPEQVIKRAAVERTYGHQLFNGTREPSRDKVIQLAFGLGLDLNAAQRLLQVAHKNALYPKLKRDAAIMLCLEKGRDILEAQTLLQSLGLSLLGER
jgi:hypothetical protein